MSVSPSVNLKIRRLLRAALSVALSLIALTLIMPRAEAEARVAQKALIQLSPTGVEYPGLPPCNTTLQACIAALPTGETINILPGVYTESITLNKRVSLIGSGSDQTILRASSGRVMTITLLRTLSLNRCAGIPMPAPHRDAGATGFRDRL